VGQSHNDNRDTVRDNPTSEAGSIPAIDENISGETENN
jgi:hypothetical protein